MTADETTGRILGDDPILVREGDLLYRGEFADRVAELVGHVAHQTPSAVLALVGPWGSGKTSVLNFVRSRLREQDQFKVVEFNPWMVADLPSLVADFFATLQSALPGDDGRGVRDKLAAYARAASPIAGIVKLPGIDTAKALEAAAGLLDGDKSLDTRRREVEIDLDDLDTPILIVLDDLDRLHPDELMLVFKLVRLVGRLPNVYYLLAYDETTLLDVISQTGLAAGDPHRAQDYLEKMVQVRLDVPPVHRLAAGRLLDGMLNEILAKYEVQLEASDEYRLASAYQSHLSGHLREPRQIKRFCGQIEAQYPLVRSEVDFVDFAIITFLRLFHPSVVALLREHKAEVTGTELELGKKKGHDERAQAWRERLAEGGAPDAEVGGLLELLGELFLPIKSAIQRMGYSGFTEELTRRRRVGSSEYFDRYFHLGVGPDDLADAVVSAALSEVLQEGPGARWNELREMCSTNPELVVDKLQRFAPEDPESAEKLLPELCALDEFVPPDAGLLGRAKLVLHFWTADLLTKVTPGSPDDFAEMLARRSSVRHLARTTVRGIMSLESAGAAASSEFDAFCAAVTGIVTRELEVQAQLAPSDTDGVIGLLADWGRLDTSADRGGWMRAKLDQGAWQAGDFVALLVPVGSMTAGGPSVPCLGDVTFDLIEELVGVDALIERIGDPETDPIFQSAEPEAGDVSFAARRVKGLRALAAWAERSASSTDNDESGAP